jgi:class 3 adenylate cyclase
MLCEKCNTENLADAVFCAECGTKLELRCPSCAVANPQGSNFCRKCGTALGTYATTIDKQSAPAPVLITHVSAPDNIEGERKTVTMLFADIKGSMELIENLDPEEARAIVDPALKLMIDAVHHYEGYVAQSTGDGIFAMFGAPVAHEDHPQRALLAALRLQEELKRYSDRIRAEGRLPIEARVGVNIGEVVVRSITTGEGRTEYAPVGHSTGIAARMQVLASVGSIATTESIRKLCEGYFLFKSLGPTKVKGVSEPINVYEVIGLGPLRTRLQRAAARGYTKFVGRDREMEVLRRAAEQAKEGHGQLVCVIAKPGVGKSRLFAEFKARNQSGWMVLDAFSVSHGKTSAYMPVIDLLHSYFRIAPEDGTRTRREKVSDKVLTLDRKLEDALPHLFRLLGLSEGDDPLAEMDVRIRRQRTLEALKRILLRESLNQPLMVIFEDLHWIDGETQAFLNLLADSIGTAKLLLLVTYRPEYSHQWSSKTYYIQLRLDPLGKESAGEMFDALLGADTQTIDAPRLELKRLIIDKTEGTPLFMEEIYQALIEEGALIRNGAVKLTRPLDALKIPTTVQAILASRIDGLPAVEKELLQMLAVIGIDFPLALAREVTRKPDDELNRILSDLQLAEFIYEQPAVGDIEYTFKHALTREVAYNSVLLERRTALHERAGQALESIFPQHLSDHLGELAHHYSRSGNLTKAIDYLLRAGEQSTARFAFKEAMAQLNSALELAAKLPSGTDRDSRELSVRLTLINAMFAMTPLGDDKGKANLEAARVLCGRLGHRATGSVVLATLLNSLFTARDLRTASELCSELRAIAERNPDQLSVFRANVTAGLVDFWMGQFRSAFHHLEGKLDINQDLVIGLVDAPSQLLGRLILAWVFWILGYPDQAVRQEASYLDLLSRPVNFDTRVLVINAVMATHCDLLRDYRGMRERAESLVAHGREYSFPWPLGMGLVRFGRIEVEEGNFSGLETMLEGMRTLRETMKVSYDVSCCLLAEAYLAAGRAKEGIAVLNEAIARSTEQEQRAFEAEMHRLKGELQIISGAQNDAEKSIREALAIARRQEAKSWELRAATSLARLLRATGRREEARATLAEIYGWFTEGFDTADLKDAKALLDELSN